MKKDAHGTHPSIGTRLVLGTLAGITGASSMALVRFAARRLGLIDRRIPEQVAHQVARRAGARAVGDGSARATIRDVTLERALHLAYGATLGAALAAVRPRASFGNGALFGFVTWLLGSGVVLPAMKLARPLWRARGAELAVDLSSHLAYGLVTALGLTELQLEGTRAHRPGRPRVG
jgi:hypothetical protein